MIYRLCTKYINHTDIYLVQGALYDYTGSYGHSMYAGGSALLLASVILLPTSWRCGPTTPPKMVEQTHDEQEEAPMATEESKSVLYSRTLEKIG